MTGRRFLQGALLVPLLPFIIFSAMEIFLWGGSGPSKLQGPPIAGLLLSMGYVAFLCCEWRWLNRATSYAQARALLAASPFLFTAMVGGAALLGGWVARSLSHPGNVIPASVQLGSTSEAVLPMLASFAVVVLTGFAYVALIALLLALSHALGVVREFAPNYVFKPTAEDGLRISRTALGGGGLTRRWAATAGLSQPCRRQEF